MHDNKNPAPFLIGFSLWMLTNLFLFKCALVDPGFIPRQQDNKLLTLNENKDLYRNYTV